MTCGKFHDDLWNRGNRPRLPQGLRIFAAEIQTLSPAMHASLNQELTNSAWEI